MSNFVPAFKMLVAQTAAKQKRLNQHLPEFLTFLQFARGYFDSIGVEQPLVVEIGILDGAQKIFYQTLLKARKHIGVDIDPKAPADVRGDSMSLATLDKLKLALAGESPDLVFIDGLHTYQAAKSDYMIYGPLSKHLVALHDIHTPGLTPTDNVNVIQLWRELRETNTTDTIVDIYHHNPRPPHIFNGRPLGIGVLVKRTEAL